MLSATDSQMGQKKWREKANVTRSEQLANLDERCIIQLSVLFLNSSVRFGIFFPK